MRMRSLLAFVTSTGHVTPQEQCLCQACARHLAAASVRSAKQELLDWAVVRNRTGCYEAGPCTFNDPQAGHSHTSDVPQDASSGPQTRRPQEHALLPT